MDLSRPAVALCAEGTRAEFGGRRDDARRLYRQAWTEAYDAYDRTVAAHYIAHLEEDLSEQLRWNQIALDNALTADDPAVDAFLGSLYVNLGRSHQLTGDSRQAHIFYARAADHGVVHRADEADHVRS